MIRQSIKRQIVGIAWIDILMAITAVLSMVMSGRVAVYLDELTSKYVQAYGNLARMNVRSLEQALALRTNGHRKDADSARRDGLCRAQAGL